MTQNHTKFKSAGFIKSSQKFKPGLFILLYSTSCTIFAPMQKKRSKSLSNSINSLKQRHHINNVDTPEQSSEAATVIQDSEKKNK